MKDSQRERDMTHLAGDSAALPARERKDFDVVRGELDQYSHDAIEVIGCGYVVSYDQEDVVL
jgi:hypothetical protein